MGTTPRKTAQGGLPKEAAVSRYIVERELGRGGMGTVFAAHDRKLGREVAIKVLAAAAQDETALRRFEQEARAAGSLEHPNIVVIHDVDELDGRPCIVSEKLDGMTLRQRMDRGHVAVLDHAVQLARGLAAAHEKGLVHRDLKPENVFVTRTGVVKILDFGIAKLISANPLCGRPPPITASGDFLGTVAYMSPEQVRGLAVDHRADIFSFGSIVYEMLAGQPAFERDSAVETGFAVVAEPPPELPGKVPAALRRIVRRCLEKDPEERFQSAKDIVFALEALLPAGTRSAGRSRGTRTLALTASAALLSTLALLAMVKLTRRQAPPSIRQITFEAGAVDAARFAPDGTIIYALAQPGSAPALFSMRLGRAERRPLGITDANLLAVSAPSGELALLTAPRLNRYDYQVGTLARASLHGGAPREMVEGVEYADWSPDGERLAVVRSVGTSTRLEYPYRNVLYETTGWISDPRVSPAGDRVAFVDHPDPGGDDEGSVSVVNLSGTVRVLAGGWKSVQGLAWAKGGSEIWFTAAADAPFAQNVLRAVSLSGKQRLLAEATGRLKLEDVDREGHALLTQRNAHLGIAVFSVDGDREEDLSWLDVPILDDLSRDGSTVVFTENGAAADASYSIYIRSVGGASALHLGSGQAGGISPDGKWVVSVPVVGTARPLLSLLPTGAGDTRPLDVGEIRVSAARWFPDGKAILLAGAEPEHALRLYVLPFEGGQPRPLASDPVLASGLCVSGDQKHVAAVSRDSRILLFPVDGSEPRPAPGTLTGDVPIGFGADGLLYVRAPGEVPAALLRVDVGSGRREPWKIIVPRRGGITRVGRIFITPDGKTLAYNYSSMVAQLYLLERRE